MIAAAIVLLLVAAALHTRLGRLELALLLMKAGDALFDAGSRVLDLAKREREGG